MLRSGIIKIISRFLVRISAVGLGSFLFMTSSQRNFGPSSSTQGIDAVIYVKLNSRICSLVLMHNQELGLLAGTLFGTRPISWVIEQYLLTLVPWNEQCSFVPITWL
ncbi:uncharacterized protein LOC103708673 isoform X2 [Phoenix dactylifera]|uniref:Uncharacterized protein LOC103708673 isoform X2 n=1 Tax=Phoenix dactylifera TaxID=42345 RepID=A0A8B9A2G1_PHODC|nr:uncharacterized protein LOC103708673 isoform X2 [Phoenix dactylifera]